MFFESFGVAIIIPYLNIIVDGNLKIKVLTDFTSRFSKDELIIYATGVLILFFIIKNIYIFKFNYIQHKYRVNLNKRLASDLLNNYLYMPYKMYFKKNSSFMIRDITSSCGDFCNLILASISILNDFLIILGIFVLIVYLQGFGLFITMFIFFVICSLFYFLLKKKFKSWGEKRYFFSGLALKYLIQSLSSAKDLRIFGKQKFFLNTFNESNNKIIYYNYLRDLTSTVPKNIFEVVGIIFISYFLLREISIYNFETAIITISVLLVSFIKILPSISRIVVQLSILKNGQRAAENLYEDLNIKVDEDEYKNYDNRKLDFQNSIEFKNISFSYDNKNIIDNFNLHIKKGEKIFIYGDSGSGKSTLVNLLMGLIKPTNGVITFDEKDIFFNLKQARKKIGYVPQEFLILNDTIKNNIAFGLYEEEIDEVKLNKAIKNSSLSQFVNDLPNKENQNIGEKGSTLSGGQRQRIAIARALYNEPEILIMDEATSAIDSKTENEIIEDILKIKNSNLTIIVISHNLSLKKFFDKHLELKNNK